MNNRVFERTLWIVAIIILISGCMLTTQSLLQINNISIKRRHKLNDLTKLRLLKKKISRYKSAEKAFKNLPDNMVASLTEIFNDTIPEYKPEDIRNSNIDLTEGWIIRHKDIVFNKAPIEKVIGFVNRAELKRPPWKLVECVIKSSSGEAGTGHIVLSMEALERTLDIKDMKN